MKTRTELSLIAEENAQRKKAAEIERLSRKEAEAVELAEETGDWSEVAHLQGALEALDR